MKKETNRREFFHAAGLAAGMMTPGSSPAVSPVAQLQTAAAPKSMGTRFRELLKAGEPFHNIAVYDVISARLVQALGFASVFIGSSAVAEAAGVPDWSVVTDADRIQFAADIAKRIDIPAMVDIDEGGFSALSLYRSVQR